MTTDKFKIAELGNIIKKSLLIKSEEAFESVSVEKFDEIFELSDAEYKEQQIKEGEARLKYIDRLSPERVPEHFKEFIKKIGFINEDGEPKIVENPLEITRFMRDLQEFVQEFDEIIELLNEEFDLGDENIDLAPNLQTVKDYLILNHLDDGGMFGVKATNNLSKDFIEYNLEQLREKSLEEIREDRLFMVEREEKSYDETLDIYFKDEKDYNTFTKIFSDLKLHFEKPLMDDEDYAKKHLYVEGNAMDFLVEKFDLEILADKFLTINPLKAQELEEVKDAISEFYSRAK